MAEFHDREHFIPIRKADLVELLCRGELTDADRGEFRQFCQLVEATFHFEYHQQLEELKNLYAPFDPDADTVAMMSLPEEEKQQRLNRLVGKFDWLLERGNFRRLGKEALQKALT